MAMSDGLPMLARKAVLSLAFVALVAVGAGGLAKIVPGGFRAG